MTDPIMNTKDSGRLRIMEKLCSDKKLNTVLLVLANGEESYFGSETITFTAIENLLFTMDRTSDSSDKGTVYINTKIRPLEFFDLDKLIAGGVVRVVTNGSVGEGLLESARKLGIVVESEKDG